MQAVSFVFDLPISETWWRNESWIISYGTLRPGATLSSAKELMDANPKCSDVIVTEDGSRMTRALGWVTNVIVSDRAKI